MHTISITKLYELLSGKIGKESAENLTSYIEGRIEEEVNNKSQMLATKQDLANVREELANVKAEIIKWMFIFWIGQIAALFGIIFLFFKK
ncbi:MAG TPA: hypothetical protein VLJ68_02700 [Chitinophagaceae bacterium]|nr:hypothetical protein [Chitinophagaceae bacterium]